MIKEALALVSIGLFIGALLTWAQILGVAP